MMKRLKLSTRLFLSFAAILIVLLGVVGFEIYSLQSISASKNSMYNATKVNEGITNMRNYTLEYFETYSSKSSQNVTLWYNVTSKLIDDGISPFAYEEDESELSDLKEKVQMYYDSFVKYMEYSELRISYGNDMMESIDGSLDILDQIYMGQQESFTATFNSLKEKNKDKSITSYDTYLLLADKDSIVNSATTLSEMKTVAIAQLRYFLFGDQEYDDLVLQKLNEVFDAYSILYGEVGDAEKQEEIVNALKSINLLKETYESYKGLISSQENEKDTMEKIAAEVVTAANSVAQQQQEKMESIMSAASALSLIIGLIGIVLGAALSIIIVRSLNKQLTSNIIQLTKASSKVASASIHVTEAGRRLSEGSTSQAASIEETSATMEETSSMVRQNAQNTIRANGLAKQASDVALKSFNQMNDMAQSMDELRKSSTDISKIIKVIDDIAFQTNMLALNAAVEAARAGDAGLGFAVVAEEVRTLAQKSAQAANDTEEIIKRNIELSERGSFISGEVNKAFLEIINRTDEVNKIIDEIEAASQEQTRGTTQAAEAICQIEKVVQQNAASAEESAASAEELQIQARELSKVVKELERLMNGEEGKTEEQKNKKAKAKKEKSGNRAVLEYDVRPKDEHKDFKIIKLSKLKAFLSAVKKSK